MQRVKHLRVVYSLSARTPSRLANSVVAVHREGKHYVDIWGGRCRVIIKTKLADQLVGGIRYDRDGSLYEQSQFDDLIEAFAANAVKSEANAFAGGTHIHVGVDIDSVRRADFCRSIGKRCSDQAICEAA